MYNEEGILGASKNAVDRAVYIKATRVAQITMDSKMLVESSIVADV